MGRMSKMITKERAYEIADNIGLDLSNDWYSSICTCFATNDEEDDLWGFETEEDRKETFDRIENFYNQILLQI